ncbi:hypothetical protein F383_35057 [Gossypium arboreum]|uniref:Uncharacterized protein n=1 Tax=Gossypium arboreum TaxID=29729 RepID=A0A0B0PUP5_GOSAR|nr:hypothetical protein F383_15659 [Gossypium arboreum]KHG28562.1 hypothetical protein F383_35057 [Gossypium arboreum]
MPISLAVWKQGMRTNLGHTTNHTPVCPLKWPHTLVC